MHDAYLQDIESLEAISQDQRARQIFLKMAELSRSGTMGNFLSELADDDDLDSATKGSIAELATDSDFLYAVEDYVHQTARVH